jgi:hypothetical protein
MSRLRSWSKFGLVAVGILSVGLIAADVANAEGSSHSKKLNGDYGMTLTQTCVFTPFQPPPGLGFDPDTGRLLIDGELVSAVSSGVLRFAPDGTATIEEGRLSEIFHRNIQSGDLPVIPGNEYTCAGSYELHAAGKLSMDVECNVKPPQPGVVVTLKPFHLEGFVSRAHQNVHLSAIEGNVQTVHVSVEGTIVQQRERICLQSISASKLTGGGSK